MAPEKYIMKRVRSVLYLDLSSTVLEIVDYGSPVSTERLETAGAFISSFVLR